MGGWQTRLTPIGLIQSTSKQPWLLPDWVEAREHTAGQRRYLHQSGAWVLLDGEKFVIGRGDNPESRREAGRVEDWLTHVGHKLSAGAFEDSEAVYLAPRASRERKEGVHGSE